MGGQENYQGLGWDHGKVVLYWKLEDNYDALIQAQSDASERKHSQCVLQHLWWQSWPPLNSSLVDGSIYGEAGRVLSRAPLVSTGPRDAIASEWWTG